MRALIPVLAEILTELSLSAPTSFARWCIRLLACIGVISEHEGRPRWPAESGLAIGPSEPSALRGEPIDIRCLAEFVPVATRQSP